MNDQFTYETTNTPTLIEIPDNTLEVIKSIIEQNSKIIGMNAELLSWMANPPIFYEHQGKEKK